MPGCGTGTSTTRTLRFAGLLSQILKMEKMLSARVCKGSHTMDTVFPVQGEASVPLQGGDEG